jgi:tetratricopeptide (TPR) repeat protein
MARKTALAFILVAVVILPRSLRETPPIPDPATGAMESQVADKIGSARKAVADNLASAGAWGKLGMVFHAHYLEPEAAACYAEAHRLDDGDFRWPYLLARILKSRSPAPALDLLDEASRENPAFTPLHILAAELQLAEGNTDGAMASYRRALSIDRGSAAAELGIGRLLLERGDLEGSAAHLERAAELAPEAGSIHATLSQLYHRLGREEDASKAAGRARRLHPDVDIHDPVQAAMSEEAESIAGYQARAVSAERAGNPSHAEALLRRTVEIRPGDASLYYNLGNHLSRQGRLPEAEESYRRALSLDAGHVPTLVNLGILKAGAGDLQSAESFFEKAIELEPAHAGALLGLGNIAAARGRLDDAVRFFERALLSDPDRPDAHNALARALAARGDIDAAIEHFLTALEGAPERGDIHLHLAALYAGRHDGEAVERHLKMARSLGLEPPAELLQSLKNSSNQSK